MTAFEVPGSRGMKGVGILGTGAVAQALGRLLRARGEPVVAVAGRSAERAALAATFMSGSIGAESPSSASAGPVFATSIEMLPQAADHIVVAVSDAAIPIVTARLAAAGMTKGVVLHTSGVAGPSALAALSSAGVACGVVHPLQSLPTPELGVAGLPGATYGIAGSPEALAWASHLVARLDGQTLLVSDDGFALYHAAAALASNASVALLDTAVSVMERAGVDRGVARRVLGQLARTTLENVQRVGVEQGLTGPVARGDAATVGAHVAALDRVMPGEAALYRAVSEHLVTIAERRGLSADSVNALRAVLSARLEGPKS